MIEIYTDGILVSGSDWFIFETQNLMCTLNDFVEI